MVLTGIRLLSVSRCESEVMLNRNHSERSTVEGIPVGH